jgi:hypothetical protein
VDVAGAQRVHPGQQHDEPLGGIVQAAEPQRNSLQALHSPLSSLVRSPQSRQAPVTSRDFASPHLATSQRSNPIGLGAANSIRSAYCPVARRTVPVLSGT